MPRAVTPPEVRFATKYVVDLASGCWLWIAALNNKGYGVMGAGPRGAGITYAHRFSWLLRHGPVADDLEVCHKCDNPRCVNPDHLFLGTHSDNMKDAANKQRMARGKRSGAHTKPERRRLGEDHGHHKLTEQAVQEIRGSGQSNRALATKFGVNERTISGVRNHESWRHL